MLKTKYRKLSDIKCLEGNPRTINEDSFKKLCTSIENNPQYFEARPIILSDRTGEFVSIAGNQRVKAAKHLKLKEVPTILIPNLTVAKEREVIIRDNVSNGDWDMDILESDWDMEDLEDWGLDLDFEEEELEAKEDDYEEPETMQVDVVLGDLVEFVCEDGRIHRLVCGSSLEVDNWDKVTQGNDIDLVVTDPPYNVAYVGKTKDALTIQNDSMSDSNFYQFLYDFYTALNSYVKPGGGWYVWHADSEGANFRQAMVDSGILLKQCLIWIKQTMVMGRQDYHWKHEPCLYGWKEGAAHNWYTDRKQTTVLEFDRPSRSAEHPTMKPIPLISYQIGNSSKKGEVVADGFLGSGTTMVAAHQKGRIGVGCELDPKYCQVIIDRMTKLDETLTVKINGKEYKKEGAGVPF